MFSSVYADADADADQWVLTKLPFGQEGVGGDRK